MTQTPTIVDLPITAVAPVVEADTDAIDRVDKTLDQIEQLSLELDDNYVMPQLEYQVPPGFKLSVVIPVYNERENLHPLLAQLRAVFNSQPWDCEVIFVDDGSDDGTGAEVKRLTAGWDNVTVVEQANAGAAGAHNVGAALASMPFLKFLDGDDVLTPRATTWLLDALETTGVGWAWGNLGKYSLDRTTPDGITSPTQVPKTPPSAEIMARPPGLFHS